MRTESSSFHQSNILATKMTKWPWYHLEIIFNEFFILAISLWKSECGCAAGEYDYKFCYQALRVLFLCVMLLEGKCADVSKMCVLIFVHRWDRVVATNIVNARAFKLIFFCLKIFLSCIWHIDYFVCVPIEFRITLWVQYLRNEAFSNVTCNISKNIEYLRN